MPTAVRSVNFSEAPPTSQWQSRGVVRRVETSQTRSQPSAASRSRDGRRAARDFTSLHARVGCSRFIGLGRDCALSQSLSLVSVRSALSQSLWCLRRQSSHSLSRRAWRLRSPVRRAAARSLTHSAHDPYPLILFRRRQVSPPGPTPAHHPRTPPSGSTSVSGGGHSTIGQTVRWMPRRPSARRRSPRWVGRRQASATEPPAPQSRRWPPSRRARA